MLSWAKQLLLNSDNLLIKPKTFLKNFSIAINSSRLQMKYIDFFNIFLRSFENKSRPVLFAYIISIIQPSAAIVKITYFE